MKAIGPHRILFLNIALVILASFLLTPTGHASRGIKVRVKDSAGSSQEVQLYKGSYALLIGASDYTNGWPKLELVPHELDRVEALLKGKGFQVTRVDNPDGRELRTAFEDFIGEYGYTQNNRLLFFYSGHGHTRLNGTKGYLVPVDAPPPERDQNQFLRRALAMTNVLAWSRNIEAKHALFLFDSCFSGTIFKQKDRPVPSRYVTTLATEPVRQFITAGSAGETVPSESTFTPVFVDALEHGLADYNRDGYISGTELGMFLQEEVPRHTSQTPQYGKISDYKLSRGDFIFMAGGSFLVEEEPRTGKEPQQKTGRLRVTSTPGGATLYVDDRQSGTTPVTLSGLATGPATIRVALDGYQPEERRVEVRAGSRSTVSFVLSSINRNGWLTISPKPADALVRILNIEPRYSPGMELEPGRYQVEVSAKGYEPVVSWLELAAGESLDIDIALEKLAGPAVGSTHTDPTTGMEFVWVDGGCFQMGDTFGDGDKDERPVHEVCLDGFYMGKYEVTQGEYGKIMGTNPSKFDKGDRYPVETVSWDDAQSYIRKLNSRSGQGYRLPTEAEWEYAARSGGRKEKYAGGNSPDAVAWYSANSFSTTQSVGRKQANGLGLYDMSGNVWEWCQDRNGKDYYSKRVNYVSKIRFNPTGPSSGLGRVYRGGSWRNSPRNVRAASRSGDWPANRSDALGFRLVLPVQH